MRAFVQDAAARAVARTRPLRNRRFRTRLRHDPRAPVVLLSPHPDDAVLSCWSVVAADGALDVVNLFAGAPSPGSPSYFERLAGARDRAAHFAARLEEDRRALRLAGRAQANLGFIAHSQRGGRPEPSFARLDAALAALTPAARRIDAPAALGSPHPDHALVRDYALALAARGLPVRLYADAPYATVYGWPWWVTGGEPDPCLDVDAYWTASLDGSAAVCARERAHVVRLAPAVAAAKLAAMRTYRSEFSVLDRGPVGQLSSPAVHGFEVWWDVLGDSA